MSFAPLVLSVLSDLSLLLHGTGWWISNTAYVVFENVKVPVKNLIGKENDGFKSIM